LVPGDRDQLTLYESRGKLELTDRLDTFPAGGVEHGLLGGYAGAGDDQIGGRQRFRRVATELQLDALRLQAVGGVERVAHFGQRHARAFPCRELRGRDAAARRADHDDPTSTHREASRIHTITAASAL
jgi:hypothetical protein